MRYKKIIIERYKAISNPIEINFDKSTLTPIIGINECGKTTILNAIYAFDYLNDEYSKTTRHLDDTENFYEIFSEPAKITAIVECTIEDLQEMIIEYQEEEDDEEEFSIVLPKKSAFFGEFIFSRIINGDESKYIFDDRILKGVSDKDKFGRIIIRGLPYI